MLSSFSQVFSFFFCFIIVCSLLILVLLCFHSHCRASRKGLNLSIEGWFLFIYIGNWSRRNWRLVRGFVSVCRRRRCCHCRKFNEILNLHKIYSVDCCLEIKRNVLTSVVLFLWVSLFGLRSTERKSVHFDVKRLSNRLKVLNIDAITWFGGKNMQIIVNM